MEKSQEESEEEYFTPDEMTKNELIQQIMIYKKNITNIKRNTFALKEITIHIQMIHFNFDFSCKYFCLYFRYFSFIFIGANWANGCGLLPLHPIDNVGNAPNAGNAPNFISSSFGSVNFIFILSVSNLISKLK